MIWIDLNWRAKQSIVVGCVLVARCSNGLRVHFFVLLFGLSLSVSLVLFFSAIFTCSIFQLLSIFFLLVVQIFPLSPSSFFCSLSIYFCPFRNTFTRARVHRQVKSVTTAMQIVRFLLLIFYCDFNRSYFFALFLFFILVGCSGCETATEKPGRTNVHLSKTKIQRTKEKEEEEIGIRTNWETVFTRCRWISFQQFATFE